MTVHIGTKKQNKNMDPCEKGPEQRYVFGKVIVGLAGQVKIPKEARQALGIESGDELVVLGDLERGIELVYASLLWKGIRTEEKEFEDGAQ